MSELVEVIRQLSREFSFDEAHNVLSSSDAIPRHRSSARAIFARALLDAGEIPRCALALNEAREDEPGNDELDEVALAIADVQGDRIQILHLAERLFTRRPEMPSRAERYTEELRRGGREDDAAYATTLHLTHVANAMESLPLWTQPTRYGTKATDLYLDLLERTVCNWIYADAAVLSEHVLPYRESHRESGRDIPQFGHSMIGRQRLRHLRWTVEDVLARDIPGDFIEAGIWRGGACILMRGVLAAYGESNRRVFAADSFEGLPPPDPRYAADALTEFDFHTRPELAIDLDTVRHNFDRYGLLDEQTVFLRGFFRDTLPTLKNEKFSILRLDGDLYSSTMDTLLELYDRVTPGGYVIIDDYGVVIDSRRAVIDFRIARGINTPLTAIDGDAVFWTKAA